MNTAVKEKLDQKRKRDMEEVKKMREQTRHDIIFLDGIKEPLDQENN